ncbi:helix-turn-helix domain-containing protein [Halobacteria archaeon AArc-curdl1]|uniref:Helix-turn-helix domain-containing protein n=1 Tax=Natronosalvus hydrolyticus TaxID=2979988 RepID=A0AAP3E726_9EURY|nr:helix-turn-helix domain-containing protein [Halobacteria archaeon AArc-curdl1]
MSVLGEFTIPTEAFVLADSIDDAPDMQIEIKRVVGSDSEVTPYFWASGGDFKQFESGLRSDEMIQELLTLEKHDETEQYGQEDDERFYMVTWETEPPNLMTAVSEAKATVLEAINTDGTSWDVKIIFPTDQSLSTFHDYCTEHELSFEPTKLYRPDNPAKNQTYELTDEQQEALEAAYHSGYFEVPRENTLTEIAETLNISRNALSARLRRGHRNLLSNTVIHEKSA